MKQLNVYLEGCLRVNAGGGRGLDLTIHSAEEWQAASQDPVAFAACRIGCRREEMLEYMETEGVLQCDESTVRGRRCRMQFRSEDFHQWLHASRHGWKCEMHRG